MFEIGDMVMHSKIKNKWGYVHHKYEGANGFCLVRWFDEEHKVIVSTKQLIKV